MELLGPDKKIPPRPNTKISYYEARSQNRKLEHDLTPAELDPESLAKRIELNNLDKFPATKHPARDAVLAFKVTEEILKPVDISKKREFWFIEDKSKLDDMRKILNSKTVIGVDVEVDSDYSYHPIITLIQISCDTHDFVIDATKLFPFIRQSLEAIFLDSSIVKLVFGLSDIREFKRDFNLYFVGAIDIQLIRQQVEGEKHKTGLGALVKIYLDREIEKVYQYFHFKLRPLPQCILEYAKNDSSLLLECWEVMKAKHREYLLNQYNYKMVNDAILNPFRFSRTKSIKEMFEKTNWQLRKALRSRFSIERHLKVFERILEWRKGSARMRDLPLAKVLSLHQVGVLCIEQPKNVFALHSVIEELEDWEPKWKESLVKAIAGES